MHHERTKRKADRRGVEATPTYALLTRRYLAEPDRVAYLAVADLFAEAGEAEKEAMWRRRGEWLTPLRLAFHAAVALHGSTHETTLGPWHFSLSSREDLDLVMPYVAMTAEVPRPAKLDYDPLHPGKFFSIAHQSLSRTYLTERLLGVIDWVSAVEWARVRRAEKGEAPW